VIQKPGIARLFFACGFALLIKITEDVESYSRVLR
jgi:hypothetical protein